MKRRWFAGHAGSAIFVLAGACAAALGTFDIKPISISFRPGETAAAVEITNAGSTPSELEVSVQTWRQADERSEGMATDDLSVSPSIFIVAPGRTQLVRLGSAQPLSGDTERTYRLVATEVPTTTNGGGAVTTILRMRLPVFILPQTIVATPLEWHVVRTSAANVALGVHNAANIHRRIRSLRVEAGGHLVFDSVVGAYVLAHQSREFVVPLPRAGAVQAVRVRCTEMSGAVQEATFSLQ